MAKSRSRKLADLLSNDNERIDSTVISSGSVGASALDVSGNGTLGQALLSDGDGSFSWGEAGKAFLGETITVETSNVTLTSDDNQAMIIFKDERSLTLPAMEDGLAFGFRNEFSGNVLIIANQSTDPIEDQTGSASVTSGQEGLLICDGSKWRSILFTEESSVRVRDISTGTYIPADYVQGFYVAAVGGGGSGGGRGGSGGGGGGWAEKFVASPSGSYTAVVGAVGGASSFNGTGVGITANGGSGHSPGNGSGGSYNASGGRGGNGGSPYAYSGGSGGGAGSRYGNGGAGGNSGNISGPGGHGGNSNTPVSGTYDLDDSIEVKYNGASGETFGAHGARAGLVGVAGGSGMPAQSGDSNLSVGKVMLVEFY